MTKSITINNDYFDWLSDKVCGNRFAKGISYKKLLMHLHRTEFRWSVAMDENRAEQGLNLRYHFTLDTDYSRRDTDLITGPCSVLEMMIALADHFEGVMDDPEIGDRTSQWFWGMISNLGLGDQTDDRYDRDKVSRALDIFLDREYAPNGKGGLFTIRNCKEDLRDVQIWWQALWYMNSLAGY